MKRQFNRTKVAKKNCPKRKTLKTNKGLLRMRVKSKNEDPAYSRQGTRAKGKTYSTIGEQDCD